ncbi:MAG: UDP-glucose 4-epimerase GalE [Pseudomonas sp.]
MPGNVLVTGGAGYIGSHVCKALAAAGWTPLAYDNLSAGHAWAVKWGPLVEGDVADRGRLGDVLLRFRIQAVIHLAAHAYVGESIRDPGKYFRNNVSGSLALLDAAAAARVEYLVFSSTCATYGLPEALPIGEAHPQRPVNPYGESKLFVERALGWYEKPHRLRSVALRYFNAAGADPDGEIGEEHEPETHLVPLAIQAALGLRAGVQIFGTDYPTADGTAVRDYVHVADLAAAHVAALDYLVRGGPSTACNLGTGQGHSVREVIAEVERVARRRIRTRAAPRRAGDPPILVACAEHAGRMLGWRARHSDLRTMVRTAWRWHRSRTALPGLPREAAYVPAGVLPPASDA